MGSKKQQMTQAEMSSKIATTEKYAEERCAAANRRVQDVIADSRHRIEAQQRDFHAEKARITASYEQDLCAHGSTIRQLQNEVAFLRGLVARQIPDRSAASVTETKSVSHS